MRNSKEIEFVVNNNSYYYDICRFTNKISKTCESRNFNYFISNPENQTIAITYKLEDKDVFWGLDSSIDEKRLFDWMIKSSSPFANRINLDNKVAELIEKKQWRFDVDTHNEEVLKKQCVGVC